DALVIRTLALPIRVYHDLLLSSSIESFLHSNSAFIKRFSLLIIHPLFFGHFILSHFVLSALHSPSNIGDSQLVIAPQLDGLGRLHN
ncbi:hypothetical protein PMAYCL1PPCAC_11306, partial [Pristionchus mayeri]